jgi:hypothetical protein
VKEYSVPSSANGYSIPVAPPTKSHRKNTTRAISAAASVAIAK